MTEKLDFEKKLLSNGKIPLWQKSLILTGKVSSVLNFTFVFYLFSGQLENNMTEVEQAI